METMQKFQSEVFGEIRAISLNGDPWFVAKDVCDVLEIGNASQALSRLEPFERNTIILNEGIGNPNKSLVSESGFYALVLSSRKPIAKPFRLWVTQEVLPQIRKTGGYIHAEEGDSDELIMAKAIQIATKTIEQKNAIIADQQKRIEKLETTEKDWKLLMDTDGTMSVNEVAHMIGVGEYKLFSYLRDAKVLYRNAVGDNVPYEKPVHKNKFTVVSAIAPNNTIHSQTRIYPKGIPYITKVLRKRGHLEIAS